MATTSSLARVYEQYARLIADIEPGTLIGVPSDEYPTLTEVSMLYHSNSRSLYEYNRRMGEEEVRRRRRQENERMIQEHDRRIAAEAELKAKEKEKLDSLIAHYYNRGR